MSRLTDFSAAFVCLFVCTILQTSCDPREVSACRDSYLSTHALVSSVDTTSLESVEQSLDAVQKTLDLCEAANLSEESGELKKARRKLQSHQSYLRQQVNQKPLTDQELAKLVKEGDPGCPRGQAYQYKNSGKKIVCKGPQLAEMNWSEADSYFTGRGYKVSKQGSELKAEYGSESYSYSFSRVDDSGPAKCLVIFASPGIAWQEAVARVTGTKPQTLKEGQPVKTKGRELALGLINDQTQAIIKLGECEE